MIDKLQVNSIMKNYLINIDSEIKESYRIFIENINDNRDLAISEFVNGIVAILDYYTEPIFKNGKYIISKKVCNTINELDEQENLIINDYRTIKLEKFSLIMKDAIETCFDDKESIDEFYDQIICIIISKCIKLFKYAQLKTCLKLGIEEVSLSSSKKSCQICQTKAKFKHKVIDLLNEIDNLHPFCKLSIELNINKKTNILIPKSEIKLNNINTEYVSRAKNVIGTLKIYVKDLITEKTFNFTDDLLSNGLSELINIKYKEKADEINKELSSGVIFFDNENEILVSNSCNDKLEYIIVFNLIKDKILLNDLDWWRDEFAKKLSKKHIGDNCAVFSNQFVSYIAEQDWQSYFIESAISYILDPQLLKDIDLENYDRLKMFVFNDIEFRER